MPDGNLTLEQALGPEPDNAPPFIQTGPVPPSPSMPQATQPLPEKKRAGMKLDFGDKKMWLIVIGVVVLLVVIAVMIFFVMNNRRSAHNTTNASPAPGVEMPSQPLDDDLPTATVSDVTVACQDNSMSTTDQDDLRLLASRYQSEYVPVDATPYYQWWVNYDQTARLSMASGHCYGLHYCLNEFSTNPQFVVTTSFANFTNGYQTGQRLPISEFWYALNDVFGYYDLDLAAYPELAYDPNSQTFGAWGPTANNVPWRFDLTEVLQNPDSGELIFVATSRIDDENCSMNIGGDLCTCTLTTYYLVLNYDEATGNYAAQYEFTVPDNAVPVGTM